MIERKARASIVMADAIGVLKFKYLLEGTLLPVLDKSYIFYLR